MIRQYATNIEWLARVFVGALLGLSIATLVSADPVTLPVVGSANGVVVGAVGFAVGGALYARLPDCDCGSGPKGRESESRSCGCEECGS